MIKHPVFVPNDTAGTRRDTAVLLVGTAREFGIHQRSINSTNSGFWITEELADKVFEQSAAAVIYDEPEIQTPEVQTPETSVVSGNGPEDKPAKKTSGNRAAKKTSTSSTEQEQA